ncbi:hypothetical protein HI914_02918 [Erysiphe necator]|nr:hypothetical protein HI914_02918 [Erysiphe necator]
MTAGMLTYKNSREQFNGIWFLFQISFAVDNLKIIELDKVPMDLTREDSYSKFQMNSREFFF